MKKIILTLLGIILFVQVASANIYITEIMHSPLISHSDGEWIELYNSGSREVNLNDYTIDNSSYSIQFEFA